MDLVLYLSPSPLFACDYSDTLYRFDLKWVRPWLTKITCYPLLFAGVGFLLPCHWLEFIFLPVTNVHERGEKTSLISSGDILCRAFFQLCRLQTQRPFYLLLVSQKHNLSLHVSWQNTLEAFRWCQSWNIGTTSLLFRKLKFRALLASPDVFWIKALHAGKRTTKLLSPPRLPYPYHSSPANWRKRPHGKDLSVSA